MKRTWVLSGTATLVVVGVTGCGGMGSSAPSAMTAAAPQSLPQPQSLDTAQVLAQARSTSETGEPYLVNGGALKLTGTSETADPIRVVGS
jgi:hypothetical protein